MTGIFDQYAEELAAITAPGSALASFAPEHAERRRQERRRQDAASARQAPEPEQDAEPAEPEPAGARQAPARRVERDLLGELALWWCAAAVLFFVLRAMPMVAQLLTTAP